MSVLLKTTGVTQMLFVLTLLVATTVPVTMASQEMASVAVSVNILQCELTKLTCQFGSSLHACSGGVFSVPSSCFYAFSFMGYQWRKGSCEN